MWTTKLELSYAQENRKTQALLLYMKLIEPANILGVPQIIRFETFFDDNLSYSQKTADFWEVLNTRPVLSYWTCFTDLSQHKRLYSVVVITFGSDPNNPGSNPGTTFFSPCSWRLKPYLEFLFL